MKELRITETGAGGRLDKYLLKYFNKATEGFVYKMLRKKRIKLNGARAGGGEILIPGDILTFYIAPETMDKLMEAREIRTAGIVDIAYEDDNILAVNKPRGILTHSERPGDQDTMIERVLSYLYNKGEYHPDKTSVFTPAFCNRLDRNTTGIVVCGKNLQALRELNRAVASRSADKFYLALVKGKPPSAQELVGYHEKSAGNIARVSKDGKEMLTAYERIHTNGSYSLLLVRLVTGRAHQIRVQLSAAGYPIVGDNKYGGNTPGVSGQLLHAERFILRKGAGILAYLNGVELYAPPDRRFQSCEERFLGVMK